jgi:hypothetical protein
VELPAPERIKEMLYEADAQRHGGKLAEKIQKLTDARARLEAEAEDLTGVAAEALEWALTRRAALLTSASTSRRESSLDVRLLSARSAGT